MYLIDTDIIIWILRGRQDIIELIFRIIGKRESAISTITIAEVYQHIFPKEIPIAEKTFSLYEIYPVSAGIARSGGLYWQEYHKKLHKLSIADCLIAATANEYNLSLLTLNTRHFPMKDIKVMNPLD